MFSLDRYTALRHGAGLLDRSSRGRLSLTGRDRRAYLQGLLTNDIVALNSGTGCHAAYLTAQGRMIADMRVFEVGAALLVDMVGSVTATVQEKWEQFIFSEEVQITNFSTGTAQLGVYGPKAATVTEAALGTTDLQAMVVNANRTVEFDGASAIVLRSDDLGIKGFDIVIPAEHRVALAARLRSAGAMDVGVEAAEVLRIEAGRPLFHVDMDEQTIPLEAGIEDRVISLTKGCYVGQEIIIRMLHRGHGRVAKRLMGLTFEPEAAVPARGDRLRSGDRDVGAVTSAVSSPALGRPIALGYLHRDFLEPGTAVQVNDAVARVTALPFLTIPEQGPES